MSKFNVGQIVYVNYVHGPKANKSIITAICDEEGTGYYVVDYNRHYESSTYVPIWNIFENEEEAIKVAKFNSTDFETVNYRHESFYIEKQTRDSFTIVGAFVSGKICSLIDEGKYNSADELRDAWGEIIRQDYMNGRSVIPYDE